MRQVSRENALQYQPTPFVMARLAVTNRKAKLGRWIEQNEMPNSMLLVDFERGLGIGS